MENKFLSIQKNGQCSEIGSFDDDFLTHFPDLVKQSSRHGGDRRGGDRRREFGDQDVDTLRHEGDQGSGSLANGVIHSAIVHDVSVGGVGGVICSSVVHSAVVECAQTTQMDFDVSRRVRLNASATNNNTATTTTTLTTTTNDAACSENVFSSETILQLATVDGAPPIAAAGFVVPISWL